MIACSLGERELAGALSSGMCVCFLARVRLAFVSCLATAKMTSHLRGCNVSLLSTSIHLSKS